MFMRSGTVPSVRGTVCVQIKLEYMKALTSNKYQQFPMFKYSIKIANRRNEVGLIQLNPLAVYQTHIILCVISKRTC
jgi:hypothetical protein